ncbi:MAG: erythromycin biosynthesis sensory transduction protein eryC1, partial [Gammaproteobacteria bacterium]|nr:erythromycin biosynthesis sensory transduction protein eryC1 [Gammaproteobacteria bacterium]
MQLINDLSLKLDQNATLIDESIRRVMSNGWLVLGPEVQRFEELFADYIGVEHCVGLANGTDAIELGLRAMGITAGAAVATVANAGGYTVTALNMIGARPVFMDVDQASRLVTFSAVEDAIEAGVTAVVVTHLFGLAVPEIARIADLCAVRGVYLFEDCAQAHGACVEGRRVGSFGDAAGFSFYPTKNLGALGDAGAVICNSPELTEKIRMLRQYGWSEKYK